MVMVDGSWRCVATTVALVCSVSVSESAFAIVSAADMCVCNGIDINNSKALFI